MTCKKECLEYDCECLPTQDEVFDRYSVDISDYLFTTIVCGAVIAACIACYFAGRDSATTVAAEREVLRICNGQPHIVLDQQVACIRMDSWGK